MTKADASALRSNRFVSQVGGHRYGPAPRWAPPPPLAPVLLRLPPDCRCFGILGLEPVAGATGPIPRAETPRDDALKPQSAGMVEHSQPAVVLPRARSAARHVWPCAGRWPRSPRAPQRLPTQVRLSKSTRSKAQRNAIASSLTPHEGSNWWQSAIVDIHPPPVLSDRTASEAVDGPTTTAESDPTSRSACG